ncbi:hypothetical protein [Emticicia sp. TH156]|uniref:hypothetical protein n=1 Tax=Emticicia sp. TH156 TaxID=2067454 RepID=UPI000C77A57B|nr:hypothetical protein [Emticicia sp. TH156]PLK44358.1 hypothetical protein C0V77_11245 [Emticicia sp. TH156]
MDTKTEDRIILKEVFQKSSVDLYYFHSKYQLSIAQIVKSVKKYKILDLINVIDYKIEITEKGRKWIFVNRAKLFLDQDACYWKEIPPEFLDKNSSKV